MQTLTELSDPSVLIACGAAWWWRTNLPAGRSSESRGKLSFSWAGPITAQQVCGARQRGGSQTGDEDVIYSSSLMAINHQSQASEVETQEEILNSLQVDHNLLLKPTLQAVCWLIDVTLSLDTELQAEMALRPNFNVQAIDSAINAMQSQINELAQQGEVEVGQG